MGTGRAGVLTVNSRLTVGDVNTRQTLQLAGKGITAGRLSSDAGVQLSSTADLFRPVDHRARRQRAPDRHRTADRD